MGERILKAVLLTLALLMQAMIISCPVMAEETIPFTARGSIKYVTVQINGVPLQLVFDSGANSLVLNSSALQSLGIKDFNTERKLIARTAGGTVEGYLVTVNSVVVGSIQKSNYDIAYVPSTTANLLGTAFFSGYSFYVDEDYKVIRLIPKGSFVFEDPSRPATVVDRQRNGSGRIEVEVDGKKYINGEWQGSEGEGN